MKKYAFKNTASSRKAVLSVLLLTLLLISSRHQSDAATLQDTAPGRTALPDTVVQAIKLPFNTINQEMAPAINGSFLYYLESREEKQGQEFLLHTWSLTSSQKSGKPETSSLVPDSYVNFSSDGKTVLLNTIDERGGWKKLLIGKAEFISKADQLSEFAYNNKKYSIGRATISPDGQLLVFSSDRRKSEGGTDLWLCHNENGFWSEPKNMGAVINTKKDESMPYFVSNTRLYFASQGHTGYGGYDLFYTDLLGGKFDVPVNMGKRVNSEANETGICFSEPDGTYYFASDRDGDYNIYSYQPVIFRAAPEEEPLAVSPEEEESPVPVYQADEMPFPVTQAVPTPAKEPEQPVLAVTEPATPEVKPTAPAAAPQSGEKKSPDSGSTHQLVSPVPNGESFYTIQLGAMKEERYTERYVRQTFSDKGDYFMVRENGWVKVRLNRFATYREASAYMSSHDLGRVFILKMQGSEPLMASSATSSAPSVSSSPKTPHTGSYTIQLGAMTEHSYDETYTQWYFGPKGDYYTVRENGWVKVRLGEFATYNEAKAYMDRHDLGRVFVVRKTNS